MIMYNEQSMSNWMTNHMTDIQKHPDRYRFANIKSPDHLKSVKEMKSFIAHSDMEIVYERTRDIMINDGTGLQVIHNILYRTR